VSNLETYDGPWKVGNEYLPYHPSASHAPPDLRDCWNRCYWAGRAFAEEAVKQERERCAELCDHLWTRAGDADECADAIRARSRALQQGD
jgi:hypothetical protein